MTVPTAPQDFLRCVTAALIYFAISITAVAKYSDGASKAAGVSSRPLPGRGGPAKPPWVHPTPDAPWTLRGWGTVCPSLGPSGLHVDLSYSKVLLLEIKSTLSFEGCLPSQDNSSFSSLSVPGGVCACQSELLFQADKARR